MTTKHTPGKWTTDEHWIYAGTDETGGNASDIVAEVLSDHLASAKHKPQLQVSQEAAANARFIARACSAHDDLLEACRSARRVLIHARGVKWQEEVAKLDAAIAKVVREPIHTAPAYFGEWVDPVG